MTLTAPFAAVGVDDAHTAVADRFGLRMQVRVVHDLARHGLEGLLGHIRIFDEQDDAVHDILGFEPRNDDRFGIAFKFETNPVRYARLNAVLVLLS